MELDDDLFVVPVTDVEIPVAEETAAPSAEALDVAALIPTAILQQSSTGLASAVFGYDIQQMKERPWAQPGANLNDYFNYGFNERTWRIFCAMQAEGEAALVKRATSFYETIEGTVLAQQQAAPSSMMLSAITAAAAAPPSHNNSMVLQQAGLDMMSGAPPARSGNPMGGGAYFKTRLCQKYQEGRCARGDTCNYAHGTHELRSNPGAQQQGGGFQANPMMAMPPYGMPPAAAMPYPGGMPSVPQDQHQGFRRPPQKRTRSNERMDDVYEGNN